MATLYFGTTLINQAEANVATVVESLTTAEYEALAVKDPNTLYVLTDVEDVIVQPDWNQNDETAADYVKNKPGGYIQYDFVEYMSETTVTITSDGGSAQISDILVASDSIVKVTFDGVDYYGTGKEDLSRMITMEDGAPFKFTRSRNGLEYTYYIVCDEAGEHTFTIYLQEETPIPIDEKFLPDTVATNEYVDDGLATKAPAGYGLGTGGGLCYDCNDAVNSGWYGCANVANAPSESNYGWMIVSSRSGAGGMIRQDFYTALSNPTHHYRYHVDGVWSEWKQYFSYGPDDLTAGSSPLATGQLHFVYE